MAETKVKELDLGEHQVGYQWWAGRTPPGDPAPGWWIVRREQFQWAVLFLSHRGPEYLIWSFPLADEKPAKEMARKIVDAAWGRTE